VAGGDSSRHGNDLRPGIADYTPPQSNPTHTQAANEGERERERGRGRERERERERERDFKPISKQCFYHHDSYRQL
jgi:hypothetical protein